MDSDKEKRMVKYLLRQLPEQEQVEFEARYLSDDACFEELLAIEDELRDAYARGELSGRDRDAFEQRLLATPQQRQTQEFARSLRQRVAKVSGASADRRESRVAKWKSRVWYFATHHRIVLVPALSATFLLLVAAGWWLGYRSRRSPASAPVATTPQTQSPPRQQQEREVVAFVLTPGPVRGSEPGLASLVIPPGVSRVRLEARFEGDYPSYEAILQTAENKRVWTARNLKAQASRDGKSVFIDISSSLISPGDYILTLRGVPAMGAPETAAEYAFRVAKR
jgi:hypothetical protein